MNYKMIGRFLSAVLAIEAAFMIPAALIAVVTKEGSLALIFAGCIGLIAAVALVLYLVSRGAKARFFAREGLACVGLGWIFISLFGCLPFYLSGQIPHFIDALFEIVSGFTTTGASILTDVEALSRALLYWRSFSHWLGGMGVLVFMMVFLSDKGRDTGFTLHILRAESPGPEVTKLVPHMRDSSILLYGIYIVLTVLDFLFLVAGGMPAFHAVCLTFGTAGTGGFGVLNSSMGSYSPYLQWVTTVFMLLFGVNFNIYFALLLKRWKNVLRDSELRLYFTIVLCSIAAITLNIRPMFPSLGETIRHAAFQVASIITTTGYGTVDFDLWPSFSKMLLLILMVVGACAGSTGGGIKVSRLLLLLKSVMRHIRKSTYPQKVETIRVSGQPISEKVLHATVLYLSVYGAVLGASFLLVSLDPFSVDTHISAVLACINNIGPGLSAVGPTQNYAGYSVLSKCVLIFDMLAGRLELLPILCLLNPATWRRR